MANLGNLIVNGSSRLLNKLYCTDIASTGVLSLSGNAIISGSLSVSGTSTFTGLITANGGVKGNLTGVATSANCLTVTSKGSSTTPVYFNSSGVPVACTSGIEYSGSISSTSWIAGFNSNGTLIKAITPANVLSSAGITSTVAELNYTDGVTSNIQTQLNGKLGSSSNAVSASKWATARTLTLTGSVTGSVSIDGSGNVSLATTTNHTHNYAGSSSAGGAATSALTCTGNSATATLAGKATNDANGNSITGTYMTKSNPTGSGKISIGSGCTVNGDTSQAFGYYNIAYGNHSNAIGFSTTAYGDYSHSEGESSNQPSVNSSLTADSVLTAWDEETFLMSYGEASHAEGYDTLALGYASHAEGMNTKAYGSYSHAEGYYTAASGNTSHAEGWCAEAIGEYSHAEGENTTTSGFVSHAEGSGTTVSGSYSHVEGYKTTVSGNYSHAEGYETTANGICSHVEGLGTIADGAWQHVEGRYNVIDDFSDSSISHIGWSKYAHIIGGGKDNSDRKNIFTVDWNGNVVANDFVTTDGIKLSNIYPIGSIYMSMSETDPSYLFGGVWEKLESTFLFAAGGHDSVGDSGGSRTETLTVDQIPSHNHTQQLTIEGYSGWNELNLYYANTGFVNPKSSYKTAHVDAIPTRNTGSGNAHNNMPPYLVVNMWKRVS